MTEDKTVIDQKIKEVEKKIDTLKKANENLTNVWHDVKIRDNDVINDNWKSDATVVFCERLIDTNQKIKLILENIDDIIKALENYRNELLEKRRK